MGETPQIRCLSAKDVHAFCALRLEALERESKSFIESATEFRATPLETAAARLEPSLDGSTFVLGGFDAERLVGMAGVFRVERQKTRHKGNIWGVYVAESHRGRGIGRSLLSELVRRVQSQTDVEQLTLTVATSQTAARRLYASLGFQVYGLEPRAVKIGMEYVDDELMVLFLVSARR